MPNLNEKNQTLSNVPNTTEPTKIFETTIMHSTISNVYQDNYGLVCMPPSEYKQHCTYSTNFDFN